MTARKRDEFLCGYALALATGWRAHRDRCMVQHTMKGDGITIEMLEAAGVEAYDLAAIRAAWAPR